MNKIDENKNDSEKIKVSIFDSLVNSITLNLKKETPSDTSLVHTLYAPHQYANGLNTWHY